MLTADVENRGYLDTLKEIAEQKKDCGVKVFMDKKGIKFEISSLENPINFRLMHRINLSKRIIKYLLLLSFLKS